MSGVGESLNKRPRLEQRPRTAKDIAQTNSTLHFFMGRGGNRWMNRREDAPLPPDQESEVPPIRDEASVRILRDTAAASLLSHDNTKSGEQTGLPAASAVASTPAQQAGEATNVAEVPNTSVGRQPLEEQQAAQGPASRKSMGAQAHLIAPQQAPLPHVLPSRASADASRPSHNHQDPPPTKRKPGRPLGSKNKPEGCNRRYFPTTITLPSQTQGQGVSDRPSASTPDRPHHMHPVYSHVPALPGAEQTPLQPRLSGPPTSMATAQALSKTSMLERFHAFQRNQASQIKLNPVDQGRLTLLKEAIEKDDLFYVVLSQIHALTITPKFIPKSAQHLHPESFAYLDTLLCPNQMLSPPVLLWLCKFPEPVAHIEISPAATLYEPKVVQVAAFLRLLPQRWHQLAQESISRQAPPLVQHLHDTLQLSSPVVQTAVFRLLARQVMDSRSFLYPEQGVDKIQVLHKIDQALFLQGCKRTPQEEAAAYSVYSQFRARWAAHERAVQQWTSVSKKVANKGALPLFDIPGEMFAVFNSATALPKASRLPPSFVFPRENDAPQSQPTNPNPVRSALHQAHLRSPKLMAADSEAERLYRYVHGFALSPAKLNKDHPIQSISFNIPQETFAKVPTTTPSQHGEPPERVLTEASNTYRLRCAAYPPNGFPDESTWVVADNYWPENLFLEFNNVPLEPRRKLHHNRYLPIDLTDHIRPGQNWIKAVVNRTSKDTRPFDYVVAVEIVGLISHTSLTSQLQHLPAKASLAAIQKSLQLSGEDDGELAVTSSSLTIRLFEPFANSRIFDTPVRGTACTHRDCFDLETFLRFCKRDKQLWPTVVDCWRCPLCRGDIRPHTLVVDGFLVEVRKELEARGLLDTRAIVVEADGSWKPKADEMTGVRSPSVDAEEVAMNGKGKGKVVEIIEIDD